MHKQLDTLKDLIPDTANVNKGSERGNYMLDWSISQLGAGRSILADADGRVIAGNKTLDAAAERDLPIRVVQTDGKELVVVQRTDLRLEGEGDERTFARQLAIADNRTSEIGYVADAAMLLAHLQGGVDLSPMYSQDELQELLDSLTPEIITGDGGDEFDTTPETEGPTRTSLGDLWIIGGKHRLICGDATDAATVTRLMASATPQLMITDPPYGVDYDAGWRGELLQDGAKRRTGLVTNDDNGDWSKAFENFDGDVVYCWHADRHASSTQDSLLVGGFEVRCQIVWAKPRFAISRGHYHWQHEPCWYAVRKGAQADWIGDHSQTTLWNITLDKNVEGGHSTQKPLECMQRPIRNHSGDVYDPFLGSGTTLIAAHRERRTCYALEIEPRYCDVILKRAEAEGLECIREE